MIILEEEDCNISCCSFVCLDVYFFKKGVFAIFHLALKHLGTVFLSSKRLVALRYRNISESRDPIGRE